MHSVRAPGRSSLINMVLRRMRGAQFFVMARVVTVRETTSIATTSTLGRRTVSLLLEYSVLLDTILSTIPALNDPSHKSLSPSPPWDLDWLPKLPFAFHIPSPLMEDYLSFGVATPLAGAFHSLYQQRHV